MRAVACAAIVVVASTSCVGPSRTYQDYERKVAESAQAMRSLVETARLVVAAAAAGKAPPPYVSLQLSEAEVDADSVVTALSAVQPPTAEAIQLRTEALDLLNRAASVLAQLRIVAYRAELGQLSEAGGALAELSQRLARLEQIAPT